MPATSEKQRRLFYAVYGCKKKGKCPSAKIKQMANNMTFDQINDFFTLKESFKEWVERREKLDKT